MVNSTFNNNVVLSGTGGAGSGGAGDGAAGQALGGAIFILDGTSRIVGCTLASNGGPQGGASIYIRGIATTTGATVTIENTIAADLMAGPQEIAATFGAGSAVTATGMGNVIESSSGIAGVTAVTTDPGLQALANNGGSTQTQAIQTGSSAAGIGVMATCAAAFPTGSGGVDQRGVSRTSCDAGAYELGTGSITIQQGNNQSAFVNTPFANSLRVRVLNGAGNPQVGVTVTYAPSTGGASATLSSTTATTDSNGVAEVTATANGTGGSYTVLVTVPSGASATFTLTNLTATLQLVSGNDQKTLPNTEFPKELVVRAVNGTGDPQSGLSVTFSAPGSGASATFATNPVTTDADGLARVKVTANGTTGSYTATATLGGSSVNFSLENSTNLGGSGLLPGGGIFRVEQVIKNKKDCSLSGGDPEPLGGLLLAGLALGLLALRRR
ncbi:MAG: choice-of-anchor Q domain-containing protein [Planctomycetota bacterium]